MTAFGLHGQVTRGKMATTSIPISPQAPPVPSVSTPDVGKLEDTTTPKKSRWFKVGSDSRNINSPRSPHQVGKEAEPTPEGKVLINTVLAVGKEWQSKRKTVTDYFEQHKLEVLTLRNEFGVKKGTKGKLLYVPQPGDVPRAMYWSEFVQMAFGVSERHINRLLGIPVESPDPPDPAKSKNYKLGFAAGQEAAMRGQVQAPAVAQPVSKLDKADPYAYFAQLKDEKQTFAFELAAMVVEMFEPTDADEIVQEFGKEVKRQQQLRNAEAARRDLDKLAEKEYQQTKAGAKNTEPTKNEPTKATKKFLVARIGDTHEFGVFPDWCDDYIAANALTIGSKQACEAERDRLNSKRAVNPESDSTLPGATNTQVPQTAVSVQ
jgi:hypothetical protein